MRVCNWNAVLGTAGIAIARDQELGRGKGEGGPQVRKGLFVFVPSNAATAVIGMKEAAVFFCSGQPGCSALRGMWLAVLVRSGENLGLGSDNEAIASLA